MADVALDDLIKKDKEKGKLDRLKNKLKTKKFVNRGRPNDNQNRGDRRSKDVAHNKNRPIKKHFNNSRDDRRDNRKGHNLRDKRNDRPRPKTEQKEEGQKLFRTLKVMGLSPEFSNDDLYKLFATEGALEKCHIEQDNFGRTLTTAIVKYHEPQSAQNAINNLNRHKIMNCVLTVVPYKNVKK